MVSNVDKVIKSPLLFGSEVDFKLAIQELKWLKSINGKITENNFKEVSDKYKFPIEFLKKGLSGLESPEDFKMEKSPWFPIYYSWNIHRYEKFVNLLKLRVDYVKSHIISILIPIVIVIIFGGVALVLHRNNTADLIEVIVLGVILASIGLYVEYSNNVAGKKVELENFKNDLKLSDEEEIINEVEEFSKKYGKYLAVAQDIVFKKLEEGKHLQLFHIGYETRNDGSKVPIFDAEDIELIYYREFLFTCVFCLFSSPLG